MNSVRRGEFKLSLGESGRGSQQHPGARILCVLVENTQQNHHTASSLALTRFTLVPPGISHPKILLVQLSPQEPQDLPPSPPLSSLILLPHQPSLFTSGPCMFEAKVLV